MKFVYQLVQNLHSQLWIHMVMVGTVVLLLITSCSDVIEGGISQASGIPAGDGCRLSIYSYCMF